MFWNFLANSNTKPTNTSRKWWKNHKGLKIDKCWGWKKFYFGVCLGIKYKALKKYGKVSGNVILRRWWQWRILEDQQELHCSPGEEFQAIRTAVKGMGFWNHMAGLFTSSISVLLRHQPQGMVWQGKEQIF